MEINRRIITNDRTINGKLNKKMPKYGHALADAGGKCPLLFPNIVIAFTVAHPYQKIKYTALRSARTRMKVERRAIAS